MNNLRTTPTGGSGGSGSNTDRPRLTDAEKKQNHIISEQKRRQAIRQGFDRLASLVPGMEGMGRSEAQVLGKGVDCIQYQTVLKSKLKKKIMNEQPNMTEVDFELFYDQFLVGAFVNANGTATVPHNIPGVSGARVNNGDGSAYASSATSSPGASSDGGSKSKSKGKGKLKKEGH
ncbi:hypothetical protein Q7P37_004664 [Cladosporium fusiforme]